jgi:hypothetical protein
LRLEPCNDAGQNRVAAKLAQRLIAAAHSLRQTAREYHAKRSGSFSRHGGPIVCKPRATLVQGHRSLDFMNLPD